MAKNSAMDTMESLYETKIAPTNGAIADPPRPPISPEWGSQMPPRTNFATRVAT